jgi:hypothetical protein
MVDCKCDSYVQCYVNAKAWKDCYAYWKENHSKDNPIEFCTSKSLGNLKPVTDGCHGDNSVIKCESKLANHKVNYYYSGRISGERCDKCNALLLIKEGKALCYCNGDV